MTGPRPYVQMGGGYESATAQAQQQTQLGQPAQINDTGAPLLPSNTQSPLAAPVFPWQQQSQQQVPAQQQQQRQAPPAPTPQQIMSGQLPQPGQQQFTQPQPQLSQQAAADLNARLQGANIPPELQGRSVGELIGIANGLRQIHLQQLQQQGTQPQQVQQQQQSPVQQQPGQQPTQDQQWDWRNPKPQIANVVREELQGVKQEFAQMMAPVVQQQNVNAALQARNAAAAQVPGFANIEHLVIQRLQGVNPQALLNPATWETAAKVVMGEMVMQGYNRPGMQQTQGTPQQQALFPAQAVQPGQNPLPNINTFFSEQPMQGGPGINGGVQLTSAQRAAAQAMGMTDADYAAWGGGVRR